MPAREALAEAGLPPLTLGPKEGLALLNGTQVSTALALAGLFARSARCPPPCRRSAVRSMHALAAIRRSTRAFTQSRATRGQAGRRAIYRRLLESSAIRASHKDCPRVQDPYSLRCQPQVMGACLQQMRAAAVVLVTEANAVSDNPLVFAESDQILSGGNFPRRACGLCRRQPRARDRRDWGDVGTADRAHDGCEPLRPAAVPRAGWRRQLRLHDRAGDGGGSRVENKSLAHPASVDSLPTSANQEDHVSMATFAARRLGPMAAIYFGHRRDLSPDLAAAQGVDLRRLAHGTSAPLTRVMEPDPRRCAFWDRGRAFSPDLESDPQASRPAATSWPFAPIG
jgi:histidine ammonia-lyase